MRAPVPSRRAAAVVGLLAAAGVLGVGAGPASAEELVVTVTAEGVQPQVLVARPGDTVRFVNEDPAFAYRAQSTGGPWSFDSGPTALLEDDFVVPTPLTRPGTYAFRVAQDPPYRGAVLLGGGTPTAGPPAAPTAPSTPGPAAAPTSAPTAPSAATTAAPAAPPSSPAPAAVTGALPAPPSGRALGLPTALAAVLVLGAGSLLLRVLLAEPVLSEGPATL